MTRINLGTRASRGRRERLNASADDEQGDHRDDRPRAFSPVTGRSVYPSTELSRFHEHRDPRVGDAARAILQRDLRVTLVDGNLQRGQLRWLIGSPDFIGPTAGQADRPTSIVALPPAVNCATNLYKQQARWKPAVTEQTTPLPVSYVRTRTPNPNRRTLPGVPGECSNTITSSPAGARLVAKTRPRRRRLPIAATSLARPSGVGATHGMLFEP
jgi:hypothetical protein